MTRALALQPLRVATMKTWRLRPRAADGPEHPSALLSRLTSGSLLLMERGMIIYTLLPAAIPPAPSRRVPLRCVRGPEVSSVTEPVDPAHIARA
jgi:hypothetical protein